MNEPVKSSIGTVEDKTTEANTDSGRLLPPTTKGPEQALLKFVIQPVKGERIISSATGNEYTIGEQIGEGNFGVVFACTDTWDNDLAVKVLKASDSYEVVRQKAIDEFEKLVVLRHPNITYIYDAFEYRDTFYIVTERCYCPLSKLFEIQNYNGLLWIAGVARSVLQAVHYMHLRGIAHQDIHLGNVFVAFGRDELNRSAAGSISFKLADLGIAKLFKDIGETNTRANWMLPPEILDPSEFGPVDQRVDIYHAGLLFLQVIVGKELRFTTTEIISGRPREMAAELSSPLNFAVEKALRRHVEYRTATVMEFWRDLQGMQEIALTVLEGSRD